jgi:DNA-3-methyladenine glycosylase I
VSPEKSHLGGSRALDVRSSVSGSATATYALDRMPRRCEWANSDDAALLAYHDEEWGAPSHQDRHLFELLTLEGAQAGLSWTTILHKRAGYRTAFQQFDPTRVARFSAHKIEALLRDPAIVRNRLKVESTVNNARRVLEVQDEFGSFDAYIWRFVEGAPIDGHRRALRDLPSETPESKAMSTDLKRRGFRFIGATVCYAYMQAAGLVNDHVTACFRYRELAG